MFAYGSTVSLGDAVRQVREERGLSQAQLATAAKLRPATVSAIETGEVADPRAKTLSAIAKALGVDARTLKLLGLRLYEAPPGDVVPTPQRRPTRQEPGVDESLQGTVDKMGKMLDALLEEMRDLREERRSLREERDKLRGERDKWLTVMQQLVERLDSPKKPWQSGEHATDRPPLPDEAHLPLEEDEDPAPSDTNEGRPPKRAGR